MSAKPWMVEPLTLPVGDKQYTVQPIGYREGLELIQVGSGKSKSITKNADDEKLFQLVMGGAWQQMLDDGCPYPVMFRAGMAAVQYQMALVNGVDPAAALELGERIWESGLDPEAVAALVAAADLSKKDSKPSTSTGSAPKTPRRASTRPTTSRATTPRTGSNSKAGSGTTGRGSSKAGRSS